MLIRIIQRAIYEWRNPIKLVSSRINWGKINPHKPVFEIVQDIVKNSTEKLPKEHDLPLISKPAKDFNERRGKKSAKRVIKTIRDINNGRIKSRDEIDRRLKNIDSLLISDIVFRQMKPSDLTQDLYNKMVDLMLNSRNNHSVCWGLFFTCLMPEDEHIEHILTLGCSFEHFALPMFDAVKSTSRDTHKLRKAMINLLPNCYEWIIVDMIILITEDGSLIRDKSVQEKVLIHGMENNEGLGMELTYYIASKLDFDYFFERARQDKRVLKNFCRMFGSLFCESIPIGGMLDLPNWEYLLEQYIDFLRQSETSIYTITGISDVIEFCGLKCPDQPKPGNADREKLEKFLEIAKEVEKEIYSDQVIIDSLSVKEERYLALRIVFERKSETLMNSVAELFKEKQSAKPADISYSEIRKDPFLYLIVKVLSESSRLEHLQMLLDHIDNIAFLEARKKRKLSPVSVFGPVFPVSEMYKFIVSSLGRIHTSDAIEHILIAADDFDPMVRNAALKALCDLDILSLDDLTLNKIEETIRKRLFDHNDMVAIMAAKASGINKLELNRSEKRWVVKLQKIDLKPPDLFDD